MIECFVCFTNSVNSFFLRNISVQASDILRNENCVLWDFCLFYEINKVCRILEVPAISVFLLLAEGCGLQMMEFVLLGHHSPKL